MAEGAGSVAAADGGAPAGAPPPGDGSAAAPNGSGNGGAPDPFAGLDTGTRDWAGKKGYKSMQDIASAALNAESLIGKSVQLPGADAKPEDWNKFYGRIGRPEKSDGYEFKLPDGVPKEMPYDGEFASAFKPVAHQLGLTAKQAAGVHDFYVNAQGQAFGKSGEATAKALSDATTAMEARWGASDSEGFKTNVAGAARALKNLGLEDSFNRAGLLVKIGDQTAIGDPALAFALAEIDAKLYREDGLEKGNGPGAGADNPFAGGPDKGNATEQNKLWNSDPARAESLMRAAGFSPEQFGYRKRA